MLPNKDDGGIRSCMSVDGRTGDGDVGIGEYPSRCRLIYDASTPKTTSKKTRPNAMAREMRITKPVASFRPTYISLAFIPNPLRTEKVELTFRRKFLLLLREQRNNCSRFVIRSRS